MTEFVLPTSISLFCSRHQVSRPYSKWFLFLGVHDILQETLSSGTQTIEYESNSWLISS
jgi:hypothetical protein